MKNKTNPYLYKYMVACVIVTLLSGCITRIERNITSFNELKGEKLLIGRFVYYYNGNPIPMKQKYVRAGEVRLKKQSGFFLFYPCIQFKKEGKKGQQRVFDFDDGGYVYIAVTEGQYYISKFGDFDLKSKVRINIYDTDQAVNFGTIQFELSNSVFDNAANVVTSVIMGVRFAKGSCL